MGDPQGQLAEINGDVRQRDLDPHTRKEKKEAYLPKDFNWQQQWKAEWTEIVNELLAELGFDIRVGVDRHLVSPKALRAPSGKGEQAVHWDSPYAKQRMSVILYLSDDHLSTGVPRFPAGSMHPHTTAPKSLATASKDRKRKANFDVDKQKSIHLLEKEWYHSVRVQAGDLMVIDESVPHFGSQNNRRQLRFVLFDLISVEKVTTQEDDQQWFPWNYVAEAYGIGSHYWVGAIYANRRYYPTRHITLSTEKNEARQAIQQACKDLQDQLDWD